MYTDKPIEVLNSLIEINNDRIAGYETAAKETEEADLKKLFSELMEASQKCKSELVAEVVKLGGKPTKGTQAAGKLYRIFMDLRATLTGKDREAILKSCEFGEDTAVKTYRAVLKDDFEHLNSEQQLMLNRQLILIKKGHDKVKSLRDVLVESK